MFRLLAAQALCNTHALIVWVAEAVYAARQVRNAAWRVLTLCGVTKLCVRRMLDNGVSTTGRFPCAVQFPFVENR